MKPDRNGPRKTPMGAPLKLLLKVLGLLLGAVALFYLVVLVTAWI